MRKSIFRNLFLVLLTGGVQAADITQKDSNLTARLGNGTVLDFHLQDGLFFGLREARVDGVAMTSGDTVLRPLIAQEWEKDRIISPFMKLRNHRTDGDRVIIECELLGTRKEQAFRDLFVFSGDRERALNEGMTPELKALQKKNDAAVKVLDAAAVQHEQYQNVEAEIAENQERLKDPKLSKSKRRGVVRKIEKLEKKQAQLITDLRPELAKSDKKLTAAYQDHQAYETELDRIALSYGDIFRDHYRFAMTRVPEEVCGIKEVGRSYETLKDSLKPVGTPDLGI